MDTNTHNDDVELLAFLNESYTQLKSEISRVIVGQDFVVEHLLTTLFCQGHALLIGVPGLAKTRMVRAIGEILDLNSNRVQFTPDLMPSDIIGTEIIDDDNGKRTFRFCEGPVFTNLLLADEINRTPPRTQAALLEAMEEHRVTAAGQTHNLPNPFCVLATQNPIEQEGTYPLPEAQLDRFMFSIHLTYPTHEEEVEIVAGTTGGETPNLKNVMTAEDVRKIQGVIRRIPTSHDVIDYAVRLVSATRPENETAPDFIREWVRWGAGPRASQFLILGAKASAALRGEYSVDFEDVRNVAPLVLGHRILPNFHAEANGITPIEITARLLKSIRP